MTEHNNIDPDEIEAAEKPDFFSEEGFDFFSMLDGAEYPEDTVEVYLNEGAAHKSRASKRILASLDPNDPAEDERIEKLVDLIRGYDAQVDASKLTFHIRGVDAELTEAVKPQIDKEFKPRLKYRKRADQSRQPYYNEDDQMAYASALNASVLALYVTKVVTAGGHELVAPGRDYLYRFLKKAPSSQVQKFERAILGLQVESAQFENRLSEDFSLKR